MTRPPAQARRFALLAAGLVLAGRPGAAQDLFGIGYDKWLHFNTSALLSTSITQFEKKWSWDDPLHLLPLGLTVSANLIKEAADTRLPGGSWEWTDVGSGALGSLFGVGLAHLWATDGPRPSPEASPWVAGLLSCLVPGGGHFYRGTPHSGWAYVGLEAACCFPLLVTAPDQAPATYYGAAGLLAAFKCLEILEATLGWDAGGARLFWSPRPGGAALRLAAAF